MTLAAGVMLGRYRIEDLAGAGGMGEVYRARDTRLDRTVAIKVLPAAVAGDAGRRERFAREALAIARITHPHICTLYEFDSAPLSTGARAVDFLAMEYLEGRTLAAALAGSPGLPLHDALGLAIQIADALTAAHKQGIVHRDLKPGNIMLTRGGSGRLDSHVKLLDFGLAKLRAPEGEPASAAATGTTPLSGAGAVLGTLPYMAPEQLEGREADQRADLFALGAIVYEMLTGRRAFSGDSQASVISAIMTAEPPSIRLYNPLVPHELNRVVEKCLAKDPETRWRDAQDLANELRWIAEDSGAGSIVLAPQAAERSRVRRVAAVVGAGVVAATAAWWFVAAPAPPQLPMRTIPVTSYPGGEFEPTLSPDGDRVAFMWAGPAGKGPLKLFVKPIGGDDPVLIYGGLHDVVSVTWSPDGRRLAFIAHVGDANGLETSDGLFVVPSMGGAAPRHIANLSGHGLSWSPDGEMLAVSNRAPEEDAGAIHLLSLRTGQMRRVTNPPVEGTPGGDSHPRFSPDGRTLAFWRGNILRGGEIHLQSLAGGDTRRLTSMGSYNYGFDWTADGTALVFAAYQPGSARLLGLWRVPMSGRPPEPMAVGERGHSPSVAQRGGLLSYATGAPSSSIWRAGGPAAPTEGTAPMRLTASTAQDYGPSFSPDGRELAFASSRTGYSEIWIAAGDGSSARQLTFLEQLSYTPRWSPDGQQLTFASTADGKADVYLVSSAGGLPIRLTSHTSSNSAADWSRDGQWIYFTSNRTGREEVWKMAASGGEPAQVSTEGGRFGRESPDGRFVYYSKQDLDGRGPAGVWRRPVGGGPEERVVPEGFGHMWDVFGSGLCYQTRRANQPPTIECVDFAGALTRTVSPGPSITFQALSVSWDGRWMAYTVDESESDIMLVENFR